mmetsp:Transcript_12536/g.37662  ORF Transcript_12536/g.37662 Transcript_12536/m.37662 type:complete len:132 (+) Transcript_12536:1293-1688(+)
MLGGSALISYLIALWGFSAFFSIHAEEPFRKWLRKSVDAWADGRIAAEEARDIDKLMEDGNAPRAEMTTMPGHSSGVGTTPAEAPATAAVEGPEATTEPNAVEGNLDQPEQRASPVPPAAAGGTVLLSRLW